MTLDSGLLVENVSVLYNNETIGLENVSFEIPMSTITALVGVNGAGKSTLFKAIMNILPLSSGRISVLGKSVPEALKSNLISYVPQSEEVDWDFPVLVEDLVMMGRYGQMNWLRRPNLNDKNYVSMALERVGMIQFRARQIGELSGGQKKRVFLARALAQNSRIILLDEPFSGIDLQTEESITSLLEELKQEGRLILVATHNLGSVPKFCDHTILIKNTIIAFGPTETTFTRKNLELAFGGVLRHFVLGSAQLHEDEDRRQVTVISDDERPFVIYSKEQE